MISQSSYCLSLIIYDFLCAVTLILRGFVCNDFFRIQGRVEYIGR